VLLPLYAHASAYSDRGEIAVRHFVCVAVALDFGLGFLLVEEVMDPVHNFVREQSAEQHVCCGLVGSAGGFGAVGSDSCDGG
jgi:hypothetical protein